MINSVTAAVHKYLYGSCFLVTVCGYCSLVIFREVFFVSEGHRKPETYRANYAISINSVHREACC